MRPSLDKTDVEGPGRVLVVDDDIRSRETLVSLLRTKGFDVSEAQSAEELLSGALDRAPDAILMDVRMPGMSGVEACARIKTSPDAGDIPVILVTAVADRESRLKGLAAGARDFVEKPVDFDELAIRVDNAVQAKRLTDRARKIHEHAQKLETLRGHLMHMIVHDVRAPLMVIQGYLELLKDDEDKRLSPEYATYVDEAMTGAATVVRMVNTLYDIDALEGGVAPLRVECRDMASITKRALDSLRPAPSSASIQWERTDKPLRVNVDAKLMERVMANLVEHASRQTPEDGAVRIAMTREGPRIRVDVSDGGIAVPPQQQEDMFHKFGQAQAWQQRKVYSTGLGLAFCKLAVEAQGGAIGVKSNPAGRGNTVWFTIPASDEEKGP